jgi:tRNA pseudouridine38-40 synthase
MPTYRLNLEYEGTRYSGWQAQGNTSKTVQGHLIRAAEQVFNSSVEVGGAGRTDAGVHAAMQVAHLRCNKPIPADLLQRKINDLLPHDIHIVDCDRTSEAFHARHDATSRVYLYQISRRRAAFAKPFVWWIKDTLDVSRMSQAAGLVAGRHDFTSFSDKRLAEDESRIVHVERMEVANDGDLILVRIAASHFLWKMVRKLVAALVEIGRGNLSVEQFGAMLQEPSAPIELTAPPSGLFLESIVYEGESFERPLEALVPVRSVRTSGKMIEKKAAAPARAARPPARDARPVRDTRPVSREGHLPRRDDRTGPTVNRGTARPVRDVRPASSEARPPRRDDRAVRPSTRPSTEGRPAPRSFGHPRSPASTTGASRPVRPERASPRPPSKPGGPPRGGRNR